MAMYKHLRLHERIKIARLLSSGIPIAQIGRVLKRDPKMISDEIKRNRTFVYKGSFASQPNCCALRKQCNRKNVCEAALIDEA